MFFQDIFLVFDKNKTNHLEYKEVAPALQKAGGTNMMSLFTLNAFLRSISKSTCNICTEQEMFRFHGFQKINFYMTSRGRNHLSYRFAAS